VSHAIALPDVSEAPRVLTIDRDWVNSQLLVTGLQGDKRFQMLEAVPDVRGISAAIAREKPAVMLVSAQIEGNAHKGFEVARELMGRRCGVRIVMLLDSSERDHVVQAFRAGAHGVFSRGERLTSLAKCVFCVSQGQIWASSKELHYLLEALDDLLPARVMDARCASLLSRREREVVGCVVDGLSNREIGQRLGITEHTVKNYLFRVFGKLGVSKRVEMVTHAYSLGSVPDSSSVREDGRRTALHRV
jgi:two-component system, NarL family, nitrate/nitrite response regulator NarL